MAESQADARTKCDIEFGVSSIQPHKKATSAMVEHNRYHSSRQSREGYASLRAIISRAKVDMPFSMLSAAQAPEYNSGVIEVPQSQEHNAAHREKRKRGFKDDDETRKRQNVGDNKQKKSRKAETIPAKLSSSVGANTEQAMDERYYKSEKERRKEKKESRAAKRLAKDLKSAENTTSETEDRQRQASVPETTDQSIDSSKRDASTVTTEQTEQAKLPTKRKLFTYSKNSPKRTERGDHGMVDSPTASTLASPHMNGLSHQNDDQESSGQKTIPIETSNPRSTTDNVTSPEDFHAATDKSYTRQLPQENLVLTSSDVQVQTGEQTVASNVATEVPSDVANDSRLPKIEKAIQKYLVRNDIAGSDFAISLSTQKNFVQSGFYAFGKQYFKKTSDSDFEALTKHVASKFRPSTPIVQSSEDNTTTQLESNKERRSSTRIGKRNSNADALELAHQEFAEDGGTYVTGPFTAQEEDVLTQAIEEYRDQNQLTHADFCNLVHNLPEPMPVWERRIFWAQFIYLLRDRKSKSVRDHLKRAYLPYERAPFTEADDEKVTQLRSELGADWKTIAERMGRYKEDVRDRYRNHLASAVVSTGEWSTAENEKFAKILQKYTDKSQMNWATIAEQMETRTRSQCRDRFIRLQGLRASTGKAPTFSLLSPTILGGRQSKEDDLIKASQKQERNEARRKKALERQVEKEKRQSMVLEARERKLKEKALKREAKASARGASHSILPGDTLHMLELLCSAKASEISSDVVESVLVDYKDVFTTKQIVHHLAQELSYPQLPSALQARASETIERLKAQGSDKLRRTLVDESDYIENGAGKAVQNPEKTTAGQGTSGSHAGGGGGEEEEDEDEDEDEDEESDDEDEDEDDEEEPAESEEVEDISRGDESD